MHLFIDKERVNFFSVHFQQCLSESILNERIKRIEHDAERTMLKTNIKYLTQMLCIFCHIHVQFYNSSRLFINLINCKF